MAEKKIKFDFTDDGSLDKLRTQYDTFASKLMQNAKNFAFNSPGNQNTQQLKFIKEEVDYYKQAYDYQKKIFEEKKKQYELVDKERKLNDANQRAGNISQSEYKRRASILNKEEKDLLAGSGKRKWSTFEKEQNSQLNDTQGYTSRLEHLLEGSNLVLKQILSQERNDALRTIEAIEKDENATLEEKMAASQARNNIDGKKDKKDENSLLAKLFQFDNLKQGLSHLSNIFSANDALTATKNAERSAGDVTVAGGDTLDSRVGAAARAIRIPLDMLFDQKLDTYKERQGYDKLKYANQALTGKNIDSLTDYSDYGYNVLDNSKTANSMMRARGNSNSYASDTKEAFLLERGLGVSQDISANILELIRTNKEGDKGLENIVGGALEAGNKIFKGDRTFLPEFLTKNFAGLQKSILSTTDSVKSGTVVDILSRFNSVGGMFDLKRSEGQSNALAIHSGLVNPSSDVMDTLSFMALRQAMPGADMDTILKERDKGASSATYMNAIFKTLAGGSGNKSGKAQQLLAAFPQLSSYTAASELVDHYDEFGNISQNFLTNNKNLSGLASSQTNTLDKMDAGLKNSQVEGVFEKFKTILEQIQTVIGESFSGATYTIQPDKTLLIQASNKVKENIKKTPKAPTNKATDWWDWSK